MAYATVQFCSKSWKTYCYWLCKPSMNYMLAQRDACHQGSNKFEAFFWGCGQPVLPQRCLTYLCSCSTSILPLIKAFLVEVTRRIRQFCLSARKSGCVGDCRLKKQDSRWNHVNPRMCHLIAKWQNEELDVFPPQKMRYCSRFCGQVPKWSTSYSKFLFEKLLGGLDLQVVGCDVVTSCAAETWCTFKPFRDGSSKRIMRNRLSRMVEDRKRGSCKVFKLGTHQFLDQRVSIHDMTTWITHVEVCTAIPKLLHALTGFSIEFSQPNLFSWAGGTMGLTGLANKEIQSALIPTWILVAPSASEST